MKRKKAALYDPYLDTMGGGERHILTIMKAMEDEGYDITIFWNEDLNDLMRSRLNLSFNNLTFAPNIFKNGSSQITKYQTLKEFDAFVYVTDGSYFYSPAKNNLIFCMVPERNLYNMNIVNRLKTHNAQFICNSQFTQKHLNRWGVDAEVVYPCLDETFLNVENDKLRSKTILSVGRFFKHLHAKRQDIAIKMFQSLKENNQLLKGYKLVLAGSLQDADKPYFEELKKLAGNDKSIEFKPNISFDELTKLYKTSEFYWHLAGYEVDENAHPEQVEHLGITPLEAMASGCITFCYAAGGPKEIIKTGETGFLFTNESELALQMDLLTQDDSRRDEIRQSAQEFVKNNFSYQQLQARVAQIV